MEYKTETIEIYAIYFAIDENYFYINKNCVAENAFNFSTGNLTVHSICCRTWAIFKKNRFSEAITVLPEIIIAKTKCSTLI